MARYLAKQTKFLASETQLGEALTTPKDLLPLIKVRDLLQVYGIRAKKHLSQNFLLNQRIIHRLVRAAGISEGHKVIEVGPGPGNLTRSILMQNPSEVIAIEKDRRFLPLLEMIADSLTPGKLKILVGDAMDHSFRDLFGPSFMKATEFSSAESDSEMCPTVTKTIANDLWHDWVSGPAPPIRIIGNLPFSVSTALLVKWLEFIADRTSVFQYGRVPMLLTFQEEVARRICAEPCSAERSRLSSMCQTYCNVRYMFTIRGTSFTPPATVHSGVVRFEPKPRPLTHVPFRIFEKFIRHLYHHRNHNVFFNISKLFPKPMSRSAFQIIEDSHVDPNCMCYMLDNIEVARLVANYYTQCLKIPALAEYNYRASKKLESKASLEVLSQANLTLLSAR